LLVVVDVESGEIDFIVLFVVLLEEVLIDNGAILLPLYTVLYCLYLSNARRHQHQLNRS